MHNFVYLAQWHSQEFSCEPNFGGGACPRPPLAAPVFMVNVDLSAGWLTTVTSSQSTWAVSPLKIGSYYHCYYYLACRLILILPSHPLLDAEHLLCTAPWSGTPCLTTSAHSRTMSPLDRA